MSAFVIREARAGDEGAIVSLLHGLAVYEKIDTAFSLDAASVKRDFLGASPVIHAVIGEERAEPVGIATWYWIYFTFGARRGLYIEDLFVLPNARGQGYGSALFAHLARHASQNEAVRVEWRVLHWNAPAIRFYKELGARPVEDWSLYRLEGAALDGLAERA